ncbi:hypothetical protein ACWDYH_29715 [Nocardia goodfellowii]
MSAIVFRNPAMAGAVALVALGVVPVAIVLTTDREPTAEVRHTPARPDGCVMFCAPTTEVVLKAQTSIQRPTKQDCWIFCDSRVPEAPTQECWKLCAKPRPREEGGDRR